MASAPTLSRPIAGSPDGRITPGREDSERVEEPLDPAEEVHDLFAIDPAEQAGAEPAVAMLARGRAAEPDHRVRHLFEQLGHASSHPPSDFGQQVHVDVPVAGVAEDHGRDARAAAARRTARM